MAWQSPISPGKSWYEATVPDRPFYPTMDGSRQTTVAIIGGGFTGLQAALNLARHGIDVTLIEAHRFGDGASGRNGGQIGTGQRWWPEEAEAELGLERSRALFAMSENAKRHLLDFARNHAIDIDFMPGHLAVSHKPSYESDFRENARILAERYDYPHVRFMERDETVERTGSSFYHFGTRDAGTGHIHPMKLVVGLARVAAASGAALFEQTPATDLRTVEGKVIITTPKGTITAEKVLVACNGHIGKLERTTARHVMPIRSFIGATRVLHDHPEIIPGGESVADSRFVVRYFRKSKDGRLLFGGREAYTADNPSDMDGPIRRQIAELYPALANIEIDYAWGGSVGITMSRRPYVKEVMPNVMSVGGYSGHGVMLSNYCGKLYADMVAGKANELEMLKDMKIPAFPGGPAFRPLLLFVALSWYALRDRF